MNVVKRAFLFLLLTPVSTAAASAASQPATQPPSSFQSPIGYHAGCNRFSPIMIVFDRPSVTCLKPAASRVPVLMNIPW